MIENKTKPLNSLVRTVSLPLTVKTELDQACQTRSSLDKIPMNENDQSSCCSSMDTRVDGISSTTVNSKSIWKQIFSRSKNEQPMDKDLKQQWSQVDQDHGSTIKHRFFGSSSSAMKRECPFYKKIPGKIHRISSVNENKSTSHCFKAHHFALMHSILVSSSIFKLIFCRIFIPIIMVA
jgi:hypothetical protein